jgi:uncharacterized membrane protein
MRRDTEAKELRGLEKIISILFIIGVAVSLFLESLGVILYFIQNHNMEIAFNTEVTITGHDFFSFIYTFAENGSGVSTALTLITAGIIVLILTPFMRVVFSSLYFVWERNYKYVVITLFVLGVITASLALH